MKYICDECERTVGTVYHTKEGILCGECYEALCEQDEEDGSD